MGRIEKLIALVGKQPMPVLIPILQYNPVETWLIGTETTRECVQNIRDAVRFINKAEGKDYCLPQSSGCGVQPYDCRGAADEIEQCCTGCVQRGDRNIAINFTGGTSMMALGAFQAAVKLGLDMCYVSTDEYKIIHLDPKGFETGREDISVSLPVEAYLCAHGAGLTFQNDWGKPIEAKKGWVQPFLDAARLLGRACSRSEQLLDEMKRHYQGKGREVVVGSPIDESIQLARELEKFGYLSDVKETTAELRFNLVDDTNDSGPQIQSFLTGKWLELFVYETLRDSGHFDEVLVDTEVWRGKRPKRVSNNFDVLVIRGLKLGAISCKTERFLQDSDKNKPAIYELDSILHADLMGLYAGKALVTNRKEFTPAIQNRAGLSDVCLVAGVDFPVLASRIKDLLK